MNTTTPDFLTQERLIHSVIHRHFSWVHTCRVEYDDMVQQGWLGLQKAADTYDQDKGGWSTHAYHQIRAAIMITVNTQLTPLSTKAGCFTNNLQSMSDDRRSKLDAAKQCVSAESQAGSQCSGRRKITVGELICDEYDHVAEYDHEDETRHLYEQCREHLRPRELMILTRISEGVPVREIAKSEGVSPQRIHDLRAKAIARVRAKLEPAQ